jgi:hypothetical protein
MLEKINDFYRSSPYETILHETNGLSIPFNKQWNNIAISVSGGADSTLLLYLLSEFVENNNLKTIIHVIHNIRCWKTRPWQKHVFETVFDNIQNKFKTIEYKTHYNFVPPEFEHGYSGKTLTDEYGKIVSGDTIELRAFTEYICHTNNCEAYYNAVTKNPNIEIANKINSRDVELTNETFRLMIMKHLNFTAIHPFRFVSKDWIISTYKKKKLSKVLDLTRSCEGEFNTINYLNYTPGQYVPLCNSCFWCKERNWGIEKQ